MLKKILKSCLTVAVACSMTTAVMAQAPNGPVIHGSISAYVGQYDDGVEGHESFVKSDGKAKLIFFAPFGGKFEAATIVEAEFFEEFSTYNQNVAYNATDSLKLKVGDVKVNEGSLYADNTKVESVADPKARDASEGPKFDANDIKGPGFHVDLKADPAFRIQVGYMALFPFDNPDTDGSGNGQYASISGALGDLDYRVSVLSGTQDEASSDTDETYTMSVTKLGVQYTIPDVLAISLDYAKFDGEVMRGSFLNYEGMVVAAARLTAYQIGPGDIVLTYASEDPLPEDSDDEDEDATVWINLVYDNFLAMDNGGMQLIYLSKTTPETSSAEENTETFVGLGMFAKF